MEAVKERLIGAITVMSSEDAAILWDFVTRSHTQRNSLQGLDEEEPSDEEAKIFAAYESGDERYQPGISHQALKEELGF